MTTLVGGPDDRGYVDGPLAPDAGHAAKVQNVQGIVADADGTIFFTRGDAVCALRDSVVTTVAGTSGLSGYQDGAASTALFHNPRALALGFGGLLVADHNNHRIRLISRSGEVRTLAGNGEKGQQDGPVGAGSLTSPVGLAFDSANDVLYVTCADHRLRRIQADGSITTLAGTEAGTAVGYGPTTACFNVPLGIALGRNGHIYVANFYAHSIVRYDTATRHVLPIAGSAGNLGNSLGTGKAARFKHPREMICDGEGNLIICDCENAQIKKCTPEGVVTLVAGGAEGFEDGEEGRFQMPWAISFDRDGSLCVTDYGAHAIRRVVGHALTPSPSCISFARGTLPQSTLKVDLQGIFHSGLGGDVTFRVVSGDAGAPPTEIVAHKCVLDARCRDIIGVIEQEPVDQGGAANANEGTDTGGGVRNGTPHNITIDDVSEESVRAMLEYVSCCAVVHGRSSMPLLRLLLQNC